MDRLTAMFEKQHGLIVQYKGVEESNGMLLDPDIPVEARKAIMEEWDIKHGRKPGPERVPVQTAWDSRPPGQRI